MFAQTQYCTFNATCEQTGLTLDLHLNQQVTYRDRRQLCMQLTGLHPDHDVKVSISAWTFIYVHLLVQPPHAYVHTMWRSHHNYERLCSPVASDVHTDRLICFVQALGESWQDASYCIRATHICRRAGYCCLIEGLGRCCAQTLILAWHQGVWLVAPYLDTLPVITWQIRVVAYNMHIVLTININRWCYQAKQYSVNH